MGASGVDERANNIDTLDELNRNTIDFYAELRSYFRQHRTYELRHGRPVPMSNLDNRRTVASIRERHTAPLTSELVAEENSFVIFFPSLNQSMNDE